jgi:hypothetical protein
MAIFQGMCTVFKVGLLNGQYDFSTGTTQTFKIALYTSLANLSASTPAYSPLNEVVGPGYTAGGEVLVIAAHPTSTGTTAFINFADAVWPSSSFTARGALIYQHDGVINSAIAVLDFGADKTSSNTDFRVEFPVSTAPNAILRIA